MMTLDPIPQAIIEVVSCECKTNCCIEGVNAIKYNSIAHSLPKGKATQFVTLLMFQKSGNGLIINPNVWSWIFCVKDTNNVGRVACITMDS